MEKLTNSSRISRAEEKPAFLYIRSLILISSWAITSCTGGNLQKVNPRPSPVHTQLFSHELASVGKTPWTKGNKIKTLNNGDEFFPVMLGAIDDAKRSVTFESFVSRRSWPAYRFSEAFMNAAKRGVKVHVILDRFGSKNWGKNYLSAMREAGVEIEWYNRFNPFLPYRYNHRTHRRVLVVDGKTGFTGGAGWTDRWSGNAQTPDNWRDMQFQLEGPVVTQLQENFNDNWEELTGERLMGPHYLPSLPRIGTATAQMILGSPMKQEDTIGSTNLLAIRAARESIYLAHSYFLPNREILEALLQALDRGVHIEIIVPGEHTDMPIARLVTMGTLKKLHVRGAKIYEYEPTMMHSKFLVIDRHLSIAGSGNIDQRSFFINDENNLHVLDSDFAEELISHFKADRLRCKLLTSEQLRLRPSQLPAAAIGKLIEGQL